MTDKVAQNDFPQLADPYRRELLAHCYRMLGSVHDAEDLVQETYLRAWKAYDRFEGRSSLRTWLHTIATRACLTALESRSKRPLPTGLGAPSSSPTDELVQSPEVPWLEPIPDAMLGEGTAADPAAVVSSRESVRLAFIAALQHLPPKQRAVLVLRDVLKWKAAEVAELLGTTTASVNSALQRAHAQLDKADLDQDSVSEPAEADQRALLERYVSAFETKDMNRMVELFRQDAVWEMPPFTGWYQGAENLKVLIDQQCPGGPGDMKMRATTANGQPAFGLYMRKSCLLPGNVHEAVRLEDDGTANDFIPFHLQVLTLTPEGVSHVSAFFDTSLFARFGLPESLPAEPQR